MLGLGGAFTGLAFVRAHAMAVLRDFDGSPFPVAQAADEAGDHRCLSDIARVSTDNDEHQALLSSSAMRRLSSATSRRRSGKRARFASCSRCCRRGRAGVPQTVSPERTIFDVSTPQPDPSVARDSMRALSPMPTWPPITA